MLSRARPLTRAADKAQHRRRRVPRHDLGARGRLARVREIGPRGCEVGCRCADDKARREQLIDVGAERVPDTAAEHEHETAEEHPAMVVEREGWGRWLWTYHRNPIRSASRPIIGENMKVPNELTDTAQPTTPTLPPTCAMKGVNSICARRSKGWYLHRSYRLTLAM